MSQKSQRVKLTIEYDGTNFYGWQRQGEVRSTQECVEDAIERFLQQKVVVFVAGRTDAGVHAYGQVAHFDFINSRRYSASKIMIAINYFLQPEPVSIVNVEFVGDDFHARFSVKLKSYIYKIVNRYSQLAIEKNHAWQVFQQIDIAKMKDCADCLIGHHDFSSFCGPDNQSHTNFRTIQSIKIVKNEDKIEIEFLGKSFLHNQIRIMVGTMKQIALSKKIPDAKSKMHEIINAKNRSKAGETAPARGLFLNKIFY